MSMPENIITCMKCGFESTESRSWGIYIYCMPDGDEVSIPSKLGWCASCKDFVPAEMLPSKQELLEILGLKLEKLEKLEGRSFFAKIFSKKKEEILFVQGQIAEQERLLVLLDLRKSPTKCLVCGDTKIVIVDLKSNENGEVIGFRHPECEGIFKTKISKYRMYRIFKKRLYDIEGNTID